jgi:hypothetical protein
LNMDRVRPELHHCNEKIENQYSLSCFSFSIRMSIFLVLIFASQQ